MDLVMFRWEVLSSVFHVEPEKLDNRTEGKASKARKKRKVRRNGGWRWGGDTAN